jgi:alcohol dehydrogenase (cytochrome c)
VALVRRAEARRSGQRNWKDKNNAWKTGGGGIWQTGSTIPPPRSTSSAPAIRSDLRPQARPGDNLYTDSAVALNIDTGKLAWHFQYTPNDSWDYDEVGIHMLYETTLNGEKRKVVGHFGRNGFFYSLDRATGKFIRADKYVERSELDEGNRCADRKAGRVRCQARRADLQPRSAARCAATARSARARRGTAASRISDCLSPGQDIALRRRHGRLLHAGTARRSCSNRPMATSTRKRARSARIRAIFTMARSTAFDTVNHKVIAKAVTDIEIRSGAIVTAGGVVFTALQDGWIIAYNDETLEELWRFNVGTPLKGAPVTYAVGPKQYLAVQSGGRHLHPVKFDKLENSSYLFVFALN